MKYVKRLMPFLILGIIVVLVLIGKNMNENIEKDLTTRNNVQYITSESTKAAEAPPTATDWKGKDVSTLSKFQLDMLNSFEAGVYELEGNLIVIKSPVGIRYEYVSQSINDNELEIVVRSIKEDESKSSSYLVGKVELSKEVPIGIYDENGKYLH